MRVIGGEKKGHKLLSLDGMLTRPTTDRVKESMFNLLITYIEEKNVLDLFAGSGALGIEAMSRGAKSCVFCDASSDAISIIKKNLIHTKIEAEVKNIDFEHFLTTAKADFDLIFLDPPYSKGMIEKSLFYIDKFSVLNSGGVIACESDGVEKISFHPFNVLKQKKYGRTIITVLTR